MPNYRRAFVPGGCWFFTANLLNRRSTLLTDQIDALRDATRWTRQRYPFEIDAFVVLPDHIHTVWRLPPDDANFSLRWRFIKSRFVRSIPKGEQLSRTRRARGERGIWQRRFWEHLIRNEADYARHVEYCYINPLKHGYVNRVRDGRIHHSTVTSTQGFFQKTGPVRLRAPANSANESKRRRSIS